MRTHNISRPTRLALAIGFALYGGIATSAVANEHAVTELDKVVVTATRSAESISSISGTVQVIDGDEVRNQVVSGKKFSDILEQLVPGMGPSTQAISDRTQSIRGRRLLILIDGISQADNRQISRHLTTIRPENIERVEIVSGASAIYGGGATGGIINIITKKPEAGEINFASEVGVKVSDNELNAYTLHQSISGKQDDFDFVVNGTFESRGGLFDADGDRINPEPAQGSRSDSDSKDIFVKLGYDFSDDQRIELNLQHFKDEMDSDYAPDYGSLGIAYLRKNEDIAVGAVSGLQSEDQFETERNSFSLTYTNYDFYGNHMKLQGYYRQFDTQANPYANVLNRTTIPVNQSITEADVYGVNLTLDKDINDKFSVTYGLDLKVDEGKQTTRIYDTTDFVTSNGLVLTPTGLEDDNAPAVTNKTWAIFVQNSYDLIDDLTFNFGLRHERTQLDIEDYNPLAETWVLGSAQNVLEGDKKDYDATLYNLGFVYRLNDSNEVFVNYSEGFEVPDASRILRFSVPLTSPVAGFPGVDPTDVSTANLDATKTVSYELGWRGRFDNFNASATAFYNESDKTITFNDDQTVDLLDQERKVYGFEASADYFMNDNWSIGGAYSFTEGRTYSDDVNQWLDLDAADVSPEKVTAYVSYNIEYLDVRLQGTRFSNYDKARRAVENTDTNQYEVKKRSIDGYTTVDLFASYGLPVGTINVGISNLLNEDYETVYSQWARQAYSTYSGHKAEGRTYSLSYRVEY